MIGKILAKIDTSEGGDPDLCWGWKGGTEESGSPYIYIYVDGMCAKRSVRRAFYEFYHGVDLNRKDIVVVNCGNTGCLNPLHLEVSSRSKQATEMNDTYHPTQGTSHWKNKLSEGDVRLIREMAAAGKDLDEIAPLFPVSKDHVREVIARKRWAHLH